jgi:hypothetical protein
MVPPGKPAGATGKFSKRKPVNVPPPGLVVNNFVKKRFNGMQQKGAG